MTLLRPQDAVLHHCDGSHRWLCLDSTGDHELWQARLWTHLSDHRADPDAGYLVARSGAVIGRPGRMRGAAR